MKASSWPHFDLLYVHEGAVEMQVAGVGRVSLHVGEGILLFPGTNFAPFGDSSQAKASVQHFLLGSEEVLPPPFDMLAGRSRAAIVRRGVVNEQLDADIVRAMALAVCESTPMLQLMREALLTLILGEFLNATLPDPKKAGSMGAIIEWMRGQTLAELTVERIAQSVGITSSGLRRRFLRDLGMTPQQYLVGQRINEAARMLRETSMPIKEVGFRVGYGSAVSFNSAFRKARDETPGSYRRSHRTAG